MATSVSWSTAPPLTLAQKVVRAVVIALVFFGIGLLGWWLSFLLGPLALAFVFFYTLNPVVNVLENRGASRSMAVGIVFTALVLVLGVALSSVWFTVEDWMRQAPTGDAPSVFELRLSERLAAWEAALTKRYPNMTWAETFANISAFLQEKRLALTERLPARVMEAASGAGIFALAPIIAFFFLLDGAAMQRGLLRGVPNRHFETSVLLLHRVDQKISGYLRGTAAQAGIVSLLTIVTLFALGLPHALLFGLAFGVINVIPFVGPLIGAAIGLMFALVEPNAPELWMLLVAYTLIHVVDVALITPWVVGKSIDLPPLAVIVGLTVGGSLGGILGMLASMPLLAVAKVVGETLIEAHQQQKAIAR